MHPQMTVLFPPKFLEDSQFRRFRRMYVLALAALTIVLILRALGVDPTGQLWAPPNWIEAVAFGVAPFVVTLPGPLFILLPGSGSIPREWAEALPVAFIASTISALYVLAMTGGGRLTDYLLSIIAPTVVTPAFLFYYWQATNGGIFKPTGS